MKIADSSGVLTKSLFGPPYGGDAILAFCGQLGEALRFRLSPYTRATVPSWSDLITFMFIETSKDDLEVRRSIFPAAHLTPLAVLYFQQI